MWVVMGYKESTLPGLISHRKKPCEDRNTLVEKTAS